MQWHQRFYCLLEVFHLGLLATRRIRRNKIDYIVVLNSDIYLELQRYQQIFQTLQENRVFLVKKRPSIGYMVKFTCLKSKSTWFCYSLRIEPSSQNSHNISIPLDHGPFIKIPNNFKLKVREQKQEHITSPHTYLFSQSSYMIWFETTTSTNIPDTIIISFSCVFLSFPTCYQPTFKCYNISQSTSTKVPCSSMVVLRIFHTLKELILART